MWAVVQTIPFESDLRHSGKEASTTASVAMLTTPREVTDGDRMCAGIEEPSRIGPT
jgi:hypothetical protein